MTFSRAVIVGKYSLFSSPLLQNGGGFSPKTRTLEVFRHPCEKMVTGAFVGRPQRISRQFIKKFLLSAFALKKVVLLHPNFTTNYQPNYQPKKQNYVESLRNRFHYDSRFV